jgi:hypothetical protein
MAKRALLILALLVFALILIGSAYSEVQSRPYGRKAEPGPPPYVQALPNAEELPPPGKQAPAEVGLGTRRFIRPGVAGVRLDWCAGPGPNRGCGPPAAQLFCQNEGYSRAVSMVEEQGVGLAEQTRRIAENRACRGPNCSGFLSITCTKS